MNQRYTKAVEFAPLLARYMEKCDSPADITLPTYIYLTLLSGRVKKRFFGGDYVTIQDTFHCFEHICEIGALIGNRSNDNLNELEQLTSTTIGNDDSANWVADVGTLKGTENQSEDWDSIVQGLNEGLAVFERFFGSPPSSLMQYTRGMGRLTVANSYVLNIDKEHLDKLMDGKVGLDNSRVNRMLHSARFHFNRGIAFALTYPERLAEMAEMWDAFHGIDDKSINTSNIPGMAELSEERLGLCLDWAQICRPDLAYLLEESTARHRCPASATLDVPQRLTREEYQRLGLPASLAVRLTGLTSSGLVSNPSLPWFLWLAYIPDNSTPDSPDHNIINFCEIAAASGAICEIGGLIGQSTNVEPLEILSIAMGPVSVRQLLEDTNSSSVTEFWREVSRRTDAQLRSYSNEYGVDPPGLLPIDVFGNFQAQSIDYPNDVDAIKREHEVLVDFSELIQAAEARVHVVAANYTFATGIALVRNHPDTFAGKHGVYVDEAPDPITKTYKNPQSETNLKVGSTYSREEQLHLCRVWADLYRPEAKPLFEEAS